MFKLSQAVEAPNTYALRGNGISVGFSSTSISGKPQFSFTDATSNSEATLPRGSAERVVS